MAVFSLGGIGGFFSALFHGTLFDGRAVAIMEEGAHAVEEKMAEDIKSDVLAMLGEVLQHPTGYYESHITVEDDGPMGKIVTDGNVIYGAWLEGIGSKNAPVTKFEGYHTFETVASTSGPGVEAKGAAILVPYATMVNVE